MDSPSLLHKGLDLSFHNFCFNVFEGQYQGCLEKLQLAGEVAWQDRELKILSLGPVRVEKGEVVLRLPPAKEKKTPPKSLSISLPDLVIPPILHSTQFQQVYLSLSSLKVIQEEQPLFFSSLLLKAQPNKAGRFESIDLQISQAQGMGIERGELQAKVTSASYFFEPDWKIVSDFDLNLEGERRLQAKLFIDPQGSLRYLLKIDGSFYQEKTQVALQAQGALDSKSLRMDFSGEAKGLEDPIENLNFKGCQLSFQQKSSAADRALLSFACPLQVKLRPWQFSQEQWKRYGTLPTSANFVLKSQLETSFPPSLEQPVSGSLDLKLEPIAQHLLSLRGQTNSQFSGIPKQYPQDWELMTKADIKLILNDFKRLKELLENTQLAIWAPANVLEGKAEFQVKGEMDLAQAKGKVPVQFKTRLRSKEQVVHSDGKGLLNYQWKKQGAQAQLQMDLLLSDLKIALPNISLKTAMTPPALFPDKRFNFSQNNQPPPSGPSKLNYLINIKTPKGKPARVGSNLARADIPVYLDLQVTPQKLMGSVTVGQTDFEVFRRVAQLKKLKIDLADPTEKSRLDGQLEVDYANYKVKILVLGSWGKPNLVFQSEPPLDREEIISLLVYGRTFEDIDEDKARSVGALSAALADRLLALGSLYFLASTPIENISYDPESKEISARIKLADGSSLTLGTQEGKTQKAGFRQRIGGNWFINSFLENNSETGEQSAGGLIEWYKRY